IDYHEASATLGEVNDITRRVRRSLVYQICSAMLILWGVVVAVGYIASFLSPHTAATSWLVLDGIGLLGWIAIALAQRRSFGVTTVDHRMLLAFVLFVLFGIFVSVLGHFGGRQLSAFWPVYYMLFYTIAGLWTGLAFVVIGLSIAALTLIGYVFVDQG